MRAKHNRLDAIKRVIETKDVSTQEDLIAELERLGYEVTQATISRDISDLGLLKVKIAINKSGAKQVYSLPEVEKLRSMLNEFMVSIDIAENLVVVKTTPGTAPAVASAMDAIKWPDVLGTVAGDDTILTITRTKDASNHLIERLTRLKEERVV